MKRRVHEAQPVLPADFVGTVVPRSKHRPVVRIEVGVAECQHQRLLTIPQGADACTALGLVHAITARLERRPIEHVKVETLAADRKGGLLSVSVTLGDAKPVQISISPQGTPTLTAPVTASMEQLAVVADMVEKSVKSAGLKVPAVSYRLLPS